MSEGTLLHRTPVEHLGLGTVGVHTVRLVQDSLGVSVVRHCETPWALGLGGAIDGAQMQDFELPAKNATVTLFIIFPTLHVIHGLNGL